MAEQTENKEIVEMMTFPFNFQSPIQVQEIKVDGSGNRAIIKGTLIAEGASRNKNYYTIQEIAHIAKEAIGQDLYFGVLNNQMMNGELKKQIHDDRAESKIGKVVDTQMDEQNRKAYFIAEVWNTPKNPDVVSQIKKGWGVSVGGFVEKAKRVWDKVTGNICMLIENMIVEHLCLIPPSIERGQLAAQVEAVEVQEVLTMDMSCCQAPLLGAETQGQIEKVNMMINAEFDAIRMYEGIASSMPEPYKTVILQIANEEKVHVGEFTAILKKLQDKQLDAFNEFEKALDKGAKEATATMKKIQIEFGDGISTI